KGQFIPYARRGDGGLWMQQMNSAIDERKRLTIAKQIITQAYSRRTHNKRLPDFSKLKTVSQLMQIESQIADAHWTRWTKQLVERWPTHDFKGRRRPDYPTNLRAVSRVNATLNY